MTKFVVPLCLAVAALATACTSSSGGTGVQVDAASSSPTTSTTTVSLPGGSTGLPSGTPAPSRTHSLGPAPSTTRPTASPTPTKRPGPSKHPKPKPSKKPHQSGPAAVVNTYIAAINRRDYRTAWTIYRHAAHGQSYSQFVAGFSGTDHDAVKILGTSGSTVRVDLVAYQTDGSRNHYTGSYTVSGQRIVAAHISAAS